MTIWAVALAVFAGLVLLVLPAWGAVKFSRSAAQHVKFAEEIDKTVQHHVALISVGHPEFTRTQRIDRHWFYLLIHAGVFGYSICVFTGAKLTSNVLALGSSTRYTMATCFLVGSLMVLIGSSLGLRVGQWRIMPSVQDHLTSEVLGDDISFPYKMAVGGMFATLVSCAIYAFTSFQSTTGSLGGWLTGVIVIACLLTMPQLHLHTRRFEKHDATLVAAAKAQLDAERAECHGGE